MKLWNHGLAHRQCVNKPIVALRFDHITFSTFRILALNDLKSTLSIHAVVVSSDGFDRVN